MSGGDRNGKRCPRRAAKCVEYPTRPAIAAFIQSRGCTVPAYEYGLSRHFGSMRRPQASTTKDFFGYPTVFGAASMQALNPVNLIVWAKTTGGMGSLYRSQHELLPLFKKGNSPHVNNIELGRKGRWRSNVWTYPGASSFGSDARRGLEDHPTVKPPTMLVDVLFDLSNRREIVLDPFLGSGTLPPRTLKSLCASVALPAWFLGHYPWERVVVVSYSDILARNHANDFRRVVNAPLYRATFPTMRLERDTDREIATTKRGKRIATSIDGTLTGLGGNLIIVDDPLKLGDAMWEAVRARVIEWYRSTLLSRGDDKTTTRIVVVMQRVHQNDLVGYLQEQDGFEVLNLPAIAQRPQTFDLGGGRTYTRQCGELLHPEHEPAHVLIELRREMGPIAFSAQYQQTPIPPGGTIIKRKWLTAYDQIASRPDDRIIISWDIALSEIESGDYSACVVLLIRKEIVYILEGARPLSVRNAEEKGHGAQ